MYQASTVYATSEHTMAAVSTWIIRSLPENRRTAHQMATTASATPTRCTAGMISPGVAASRWPEKSAPYRSKKLCTVTKMLPAHPEMVAKTSCSGNAVNPPCSCTSRSATFAASFAMTAAAAREASYHCPRSGPRRRYIRITQTTNSGISPSSSTIVSDIRAQASSAPTATGTHQRGTARSRISHTSSSGICVARWSGLPSISWPAAPGVGASRIPPAISARISPSRPVARPLATSATSSTTMVRFSASSEEMTQGSSPPCSHSSAANSGISMV